MLSTADMKGSPTFTLRQVAQSRTSVHSSRHLAPQQWTVFRSGKEINGLAGHSKKVKCHWKKITIYIQTEDAQRGISTNTFSLTTKATSWCQPKVLDMDDHTSGAPHLSNWSIADTTRVRDDAEYPDSKCYGIFGWLYPVWQWYFQQCRMQFSFQLIVHDFDGASPAQKLNSSKKFATIVQYTTQSRM